VAGKRKEMTPGSATTTANKRQKQDMSTTPAPRQLQPPAPRPADVHHQKSSQALHNGKVPGKEPGPGLAGFTQQKLAAKAKQPSQAPGVQTVRASPSAEAGRSKAANQRKKARQKAKRLAAQASAGGGVKLPTAGKKAFGEVMERGQTGTGEAGVELPMGVSAEGSKKRRKGKPKGGVAKAVGVPAATQTEIQQPQLGEQLWLVLGLSRCSTHTARHSTL
jgi:hypothetical protein